MKSAADLVVEMFAADDAAWRARVAELEQESASYRELAQLALHNLHEMTVTNRRLRDRVQRLLAELQARRSEAA